MTSDVPDNRREQIAVYANQLEKIAIATGEAMAQFGLAAQQAMERLNGFGGVEPWCMPSRRAMTRFARFATIDGPSIECDLGGLCDVDAQFYTLARRLRQCIVSVLVCDDVHLEHHLGQEREAFYAFGTCMRSLDFETYAMFYQEARALVEVHASLMMLRRMARAAMIDLQRLVDTVWGYWRDLVDFVVDARTLDALAPHDDAILADGWPVPAHLRPIFHARDVGELEAEQVGMRGESSAGTMAW